MLPKDLNLYRALLTLPLWLVLEGIFFAPAHAQKLHRYEFESPHMGTRFRIILYAPDDSVAGAASDSAFKRIDALNDIFSDYKRNSELNRLSARSGTSRFIKISPPLFDVLIKAQTLAQQTGGAFDITVGPYVKLWREMRRKKTPRLPYKNNLYKLGQSVGYQHVKVDRSNLSVALEKPDMQLDLGGIAKGYAADETLRILHEFGIHIALVDAGGDIIMGDAPPEKEEWRVSIPIHNQHGDIGYMTLLLSNQAVATSGDLFQYIEIDGKRYSHIIDPHTGLGLTNQSSVTVVAPDGITADSYASAVSVMGPDQGIKFIEEKENASARVEYHENSDIKRIETTDFKNFRKK